MIDFADISKPKFDFKTEMKKRENIPANKMEAFKSSLLEWVTFWRENPHRFVEDYLQINLKDFQKVLLIEFSKSQNTIMIATRGIGKSFITALYACVIAILYPGSKIVIACGNKGQAKTFISEKIESELCNMSLMLNREIKDFKTESEQKKVIFKNGSTIVATNASANRRGLRATLLIVDEAVMIDKNILESVLQPFLNVVRKRPYTNKRKYRGHKDAIDNQQIYLTSAWFKAHYFYTDYYTDYIKKMLKGQKNRVFNLSYETPLRNDLLPQARVNDAISTMDPMTFQMEFESIFYGESGDSFFKSSEINNCRKLNDVYYPPTNLEYMSYSLTNTWQYPLLKEEDEVRVLSSDIAIMAGKKNDNSIYSLYRIRKCKKNFKIELPHLESHNGETAERQAVLIKRLFYDFQCNRMIIDSNGIGMTVFNELKKETYDDERDITYPAWGAYNEENVLPELEVDGVCYVMFSMKASAETNHRMALQLKSYLMSNKISLPAMENDARYYLEDQYNYSAQTGDVQARLMLPYIETSLLFTEMISLCYNVLNNKIQIKEQGSARKDRYSSVAYGVLLCNMIIEEMEQEDDSDSFIFFT